MKTSFSFSDIPSCCDIRCVLFEQLYEREQTFFRAFLPEARTIIVLGHHITNAEEWIWSEPPGGRYRCGANDHMTSILNTMLEQISGYSSRIVPYPYKSGLQFRYVAQAAGLGRIGRSSFLLHPEWGPWIHLRVFATEKEIDGFNGEITDDFCEDCDKCIRVCPAKAFEDGFDGLKCRQYRLSKGDYKPTGEKGIHIGCKKCAIACQAGKRPTGRFPRL